MAPNGDIALSDECPCPLSICVLRVSTHQEEDEGKRIKGVVGCFCIVAAFGIAYSVGRLVGNLEELIAFWVFSRYDMCNSSLYHGEHLPYGQGWVGSREG